MSLAQSFGREKDNEMFPCAPTVRQLATRPFWPYRMVREARPVRRVGPIELRLTCSITALLAMFTSHLICTIEASQLAALVAFAWLLRGG